MAIETDFTVYPDSKVIRHTSSNDTVHELSAFYSWLQNLFDEPGYMSYQKPIKYNTPTSYTMLNGWFLDNGDGSNILEYLTGGSIDTTGYDTIADPVYMMDIDGESVEFVAGDLDEEILDDASAVGPLLAFKANYPIGGKARFWVRDTNSNGAIAVGSNITMTSPGLASYTNTLGPSEDGDEIYANVYTIASWAGSPNAQVYIKQQHPVSGNGNIRVIEWSNADSWDRGSTTTEEIDILLPVKLGGTVIDSGEITLYGRQTGDTFTHYTTNLSTTGASRTPIAVETSADTVNVTKGEHYLFYNGGTSPSISEGNVVQDASTDSTSPPTWYAEVVSHTSWDAATGYLVLRGLRGTPANTDDVYVGNTDTTANVNGTVGGTYATYNGEGGTPPTSGTVVGSSSGARRTIKAIQDDGTAGKLLLGVDESVTGSSKDVYYIDFTATENIEQSGTPANYYDSDAVSVSIISDYTDVTIAHVNGTLVMNEDTSGTFEVGEVVTWSAGSYSAIYLKSATTTEMTLGNVSDETNLNTTALTITGASSGATQTTNGTGGLTDEYKEGFAFPQQSEFQYAVVIEGGSVYNAGRTLEDIYAYIQYKCRDGETDVFYKSTGSAIETVQGQFYIKAYTSYGTSKVAPFGTLAGGVFFGARGIWIEGIDSSDDNSVSLTDDINVVREPDTSITVTVSNTRVGDRIIVYLEDGSTGLPDKDQYTIQGTPAAGSSSISKTTGTDFPKDTPPTGWVYVIDNAASEEHKYRIKSWTSETLTLADKVIGTDEGTGSATQIDDTGSFASAEIGDIILNTTNSGFSYITTVTSNDSVQVTVNSDGYTWASAGFEMNSLVQGYTSADTFYIPYLEDIEDAGTEGSPGSSEKSLIYVSDRAVGIRVRNVGGVQAIQPFNTTNDILITGMSQSVIRTDDDVYT